MKRIFHILLAALCLLLALPAFAQDTETDVPWKTMRETIRPLFDCDTVRDNISKRNKPVYFTDEKLKETLHGKTVEIPSAGKIDFQYLKNRRTLTGLDCSINRIPSAVKVGAGQKNLDHLVNDELNDYCEFSGVADVGLGFKPIVSVRDASCYYAKGTTAGFSLVANTDNGTLLSLNLIKMMTITFYRDGMLKETLTVEDGQAGAGVNLSLISIPGSDESSVDVEVKSTCVFDEICIGVGGVDVELAQVFRIRYAYVGDARVFTITENQDNGSLVPKDPNDGTTSPFIEYDKENNANVVLDYVKGFNPVLLGIPFPISDGEMKAFTDADYDNSIAFTPILGLAYMGGAKFMMKDKEKPKREVYAAGTEVGFKYTNVKVLELNLGDSWEIILFNRDGKEVQKTSVSAGVLGLGVAAGGIGTVCITSTVPFSGAELRMMGGLKVSLGGLGAHYAYVRYQPESRHHCPINPSADITLCAEQKSYQLLSNPNIPVKWTLEDWPDGGKGKVSVTSGGLAKWADDAPSGKYKFRAMAADGCYDYVIIGYDDFPTTVTTMGTPLINADETDKTYQLSTYREEDKAGALLIIDGKNTGEYILDSDINNKTTWTGLELLSNQMIIGVKRTDDGNIVDYSAKGNSMDNFKQKRVGFVVSSSVVGLNLSVLNFWHIKCYKDGKKVYDHVINESNAISLALAGSDGNTKTGINQSRYSITLPYYDDNENVMRFDEIQLWSSGTAKVELSNLDIYYAFVEDEDADGANPLNCSATQISTVTTKSSIDYSFFGKSSLVSAIGSMDNISYLVDDDPKLQTSFNDVAVAGVATRTTIQVFLGRTLDFRNELGIVMRKDTYVADVSLGTGMKIYTMYNGEPTGDEFSQWGVLGANVAGYGDRQIFYIHPKRLYDEVVIDYGGTVEVSDNPQFFGIFMRADSDADGIPDCQDQVSCLSNISDISVDDVCEGSEIYIKARGSVDNTYWVQISDPTALKQFETLYPSKNEGVNDSNEDVNQVNTGEEVIKFDGTYLSVRAIVVENEKDPNIEVSYTTDKPGQYHLTICDANKTPLSSSVYYVHPTETEWRRNAASSDWNNWTNWSKGTPYCCTNVIIPDNAKVYPILSEEIKEVEEADKYCCNGILLRPGAFIGAVNKLNYEKAWVQMELEPNVYNLISAPLKEMITGDMFIPADSKGTHNPDPFTDLDATTAKQNRFNPTIYQRMWDKAVDDRLWNTTTAEYKHLSEMDPNINGMTLAKWSKNFNHLNTPYTLGMGFSVWVDNGKLPADQLFRFTFPKEHESYYYYNDFTQEPIKWTEIVNKEEVTKYVNETGLHSKTADIGRFIYEPTATTAAQADDETGTETEPVTPALTGAMTARPWKKEIAQSKEENKIVYDRNIYDFPTEGMKTEITAGGSSEYFLFGNPFMSPINSRQFIEGNRANIKGIMSYDGNQTASLIYDESSNTYTKTGAIEEIPPMTAVYVIAKATDGTAVTVNLTEEMITPSEPVESSEAQGIQLRVSSGNYSSSMMALTESDMTSAALFDNEVAPRLAIFSVVDGEACDILPAADNIPLTIIADKGEEVKVEFLSSTVNRDEWVLRDNATGTEYTFDHSVTLPAGTGTTSGRFCLKKIGTALAVEEIEGNGSGCYVTVTGSEIKAISLGAEIEALEAYTLSGVKAAANYGQGSELSVRVGAGVYVVRVKAGAAVSTHKVLVRP